MFSRIVLCVDGSEHARHATEAAIALARAFASEIVVVNAATPPPADVFALDLDPALGRDDLSAGSRDAQKAILCVVSQQLEAANVRHTLRAVSGPPVEEVIRLAEEEKADLIIVGSRGLGGFQRLLVGSVSDGVVHHAPCPSLVVR